MSAAAVRGVSALLGGLLVAAAAVVSSSPAAAATTDAATTAPDAPVTWSVTPSAADGPDGRRVVEVELDPGQRVTQHLAVKNFSEREATFALTAADGYYTDTGRFTMLPADRASADAGTWIAVQPTVTLAPNETRIVAFDIVVPENATPGDHAAGVAASVRSSSPGADGTRVGVDSRVGFRVSTRVTGDLAPALTVDGLRADYTPSWSLFAPGTMTYDYTVRNSGNTALALTDTVDAIASDRGTLLPGESRAVRSEARPAWPLGLLFVEVSVSAGVPDSSLVVAPATQTLVVWAVPWLHLLAILGLVLIGLAASTGRRRSRRRVDDLIARAREEGRRETVEAS